MMEHNRRRNWIDPILESPSEACIAACHGNTFLASLLLQRGFRDPQTIRAFLDPDQYIPAPPDQLPDLVRASQLLHDAIADKKRIMIWGDFDVDGQTASALLLNGLMRFGADVRLFIPDRVSDSHGIKVNRLQEQLAAHRPDLLLTCDTGIAEFAALEYADQVGLPVIVTDHHEPEERLPPAAAIINPRCLPPRHQLASLPGVGVAFKLMQHLYAAYLQERHLPELLDLVALGIVGDVAQQTFDTRYLLQRGMEQLRQTERIGLQALLEVANLTPAQLTGERIAYQLAPRLNAAGRLTNANIAVELLTTHDRSKARILAQQLEGLNTERRVMTRQIELAADAMIAKQPALLNYAALVLYQPEWHPGIIGIVASHLADRYARPVVLLSGSEMARGSARAASNDSYNLAQALMQISDMLNTYGGHPGAAGLSLRVERIDLFRERFSDAVAHTATTTPNTLPIDIVLPFSAISLDLASQLQQLAPFGEGNPSPVIVTRGVRLNHSAIIGRDSQHRRLVIEDADGKQQTILWWHSAAERLPDAPFDVAYNLAIGERQDVQLVLVDYRLRRDLIVELPKPEIKVNDWRGSRDPLGKIKALLAETPHALVWAEGESRKDHPDWKRRAELTPCETLIIYTLPSDPEALQQALERTQPQTLHLIGANSPISTIERVLEVLQTAVQNVVAHHGSETTLEVLCGATASSPSLVRAALDYLTVHRRIMGVRWNANANAKLHIAAIPVQEERTKVSARLYAVYAEMEAFRRYLKTASVASWIS